MSLLFNKIYKKWPLHVKMQRCLQTFRLKIRLIEMQPKVKLMQNSHQKGGPN